MNRVIWILVVIALGVIIASLGSGLFHLSRGGEQDSARLARALTIRITVSLVLFALLMLAWYFGLISPHPLAGAAP
jgi:type IV secretory pathway TrbL component